MPIGVDLPKPSTHLMLLEKLPELFPELVERVEWDVREGGFRNVLDFLASIRVAEFLSSSMMRTYPSPMV